RANAAAADLAPITAEDDARLVAIYDELIRAHVHGRW
ncbi:MAG: aldo/keto reductase, partial [Actinomycetales bacterium]|nr:aldo/keto reductase [Actinomycetales bacterium]